MRYSIFLILALLLAGCSKTPDYVIDEDTMVRLMADIHKGEAYAEINSGKFYGDSVKKTLKQSILHKYDVTPEKFDTSLAWYGNHIEIYQEVYQSVMDRLEAEDKKLIAEAKKKGAETPTVAGDSVNLWEMSPVKILSRVYGDSALRFDLKADENFQKGDVFQWNFKNTVDEMPLHLFMGVDYSDGSSSYYTLEQEEGWNNIRFQCDSTKQIKRVYGIGSYDGNKNQIIYVDSIQLVRTRIDKSVYYLINRQKNFYSAKHLRELRNKRKQR